MEFPPVLLPALLTAVRRCAAIRKRNLTNAELRSLAENLKKKSWPS
jgi:hypothetical protein